MSSPSVTATMLTTVRRELKLTQVEASFYFGTSLPIWQRMEAGKRSGNKLLVWAIIWVFVRINKPGFRRLAASAKDVSELWATS